MLKRQTTGSVVCPNCGRLVGVRDEKCFNCGRVAPGLWGFTPALQAIARDVSFSDVVFGGCLLMYVVAAALRPSALLESFGFFSLLAPGFEESWLLGMSGAVPVFQQGRWWTVLSAAWLHGGLIHFAFNMYWIRNLGDEVVEILGLGRTLIVYTAGSVIGFAGTSVVFLLLGPQPFPFGLAFFQGGAFVLGASASLCGLVGGLYAYSQRGGSRWLEDYIKRFAFSILLIGLIPGIDTWAHVFGFLGGYLVARAMRPLEDENVLHFAFGLLCLLAFAAAIVISVLHGLPLYRASV